MFGGEKGVIFLFMIVIDYQSLVSHYDDVMAYAIKTCDSFSVITKIVRPYSKRPPRTIHDDLLIDLESNLLYQFVGIRKWSNGGVRDNHTVMNLYQCNRGLYTQLMCLPNLLSFEKVQLPEDICFYRNNAVWLSTITHEKIAYLYAETKADLMFLEKLNIQYNINPFPNERYHLPQQS